MSKSFIEIIADYQKGDAIFTDKLVDLGFGDYTDTGYDLYDSSVKFYDVNKNDRLNSEQLDYIFSTGFSLIFLNHTDGMETLYSTENRSGERK